MADPFKLRFEEAIEFFKQKTPLPSQSWDDFVNQAQDFAFTIAGVTGADLLNDSYNLILSALENGDTYEDFKKGFNAAVERAGWTGLKPWRQSLVFHQSLRSAYQAGRYKQMTDPYLLKTRGYWKYTHNDSRVPRKHHLALDGKIFPADSGFWKTAFPPNGYQCKCSVFALSKRDLEHEGLEVSEAPSSTVTVRDKATGENYRVPAVDGKPVAEPGFIGAPGSSDSNKKQEIIEQSAARLPDWLRRQVKEKLNGD